ncbi:MAG: MoxR family ATPase [Roseivirga sp.]|uniref:AAA family ATPase n=1 Tax=Roseivirga sp. TaxID=1964215 RepID=UPI001B2B7BFF|nr:MoxR family ATPase [Roseivirga sp.]MBO6661641.1 MoxR family ATPase [Roseivirga sp.]MBO6760750.1 MoxR family ATPase [Roseivirga sp.]MBO6908374.1 MoxR family ATPase [Roseivirga sp.]
MEQMEDKPEFESRLDLSVLQGKLGAMRAEIGKVLVGQQEMVDMLLVSILSNGHVLLEGVPGVAKTLTAKLLAKVIKADFSRIQFTPDLMPSDVLGTSIFNQKKTEFEFKPGPIFSNIILIDEINRAPAKTQAALFEVMEERQVTVDGETRKMTEPYFVVATQNPIEQEGTYRLPEAQLDRFLFKLTVGYPSIDQEMDILINHHEQKVAVDLETVQPVLSPSDIAEFKKVVGEVHVEQEVLKYIAEIVAATRKHVSLILGASPRASVSILAASKAFAAMNGRDFVTPEDVKFIAVPVMRHRVILTPESEMEGISSDEIIKEIIDKVEVPR